MDICKSYGRGGNNGSYDSAEKYGLGGYDQLDIWRMLLECSYMASVGRRIYPSNTP